MITTDLITTDFEKLKFNGASVEAINRDNGSVTIELKGAFISKEHPQSEGSDWLIDEGLLRLLNVSSEEAFFWYDSKESKPHPNPEYPLDEITKIDMENGVFKFSGLLDREPWVEWNVYANNFEFEAVAKHKISGWEEKESATL